MTSLKYNTMADPKGAMTEREQRPLYEPN